MVTKKSSSKERAPRKKKGLTAKQEQERERLEILVSQNEERLSNGTTAAGLPLSEKQIETTRQIIKTQQEKLKEIYAITETV
jgi:hypothetical protein